jgi:hypothetical protein
MSLNSPMGPAFFLLFFPGNQSDEDDLTGTVESKGGIGHRFIERKPTRINDDDVTLILIALSETGP